MRLGITGPDGSSGIDELTHESYQVMKKIFSTFCSVLRPDCLVTSSDPWAYYIPVEVGKELGIPVRILSPVSFDLVNIGSGLLVRFAPRDGEDLNRRHTEFRKVTKVVGTPLIYDNGIDFVQNNFNHKYMNSCDAIVMLPSYCKRAISILSDWSGKKYPISRKVMDMTSIENADKEWEKIQFLKGLSREQFVQLRRSGKLTNKLFQGIMTDDESRRDNTDDETPGGIKT